MTAMVEIDHLSKSFGDIRAVNDITFNVMKGEVLGFLGPNGAGKTTTMRMIAGFLAPSAGTARICGRDVREDPVGVRQAIGYLAEGSPSYDEMSAGGFLKFIAEIRGYTGKERDDKVAYVAARVGLSHMLERPIDILSKGYRRRVGLAQSIIHDPPVLLLDEPTDGLDPNQKHDVRKLIAEMAPERAIIVSTHILEEVEAVCTRAMIIGDGRVLADGTAEELRAKLPRSNIVCVVVPLAAAAEARAQLSRLPSVAAVHEDQPAGRYVTLRVTPQAGPPITATVAAAVRERAIPAVEIFQERGSLDEVFRLVTTGGPSQAAA